MQKKKELPLEYSEQNTKAQKLLENESFLLQEAEWIREQARDRRRIEEDNWELIQEQQRLLDAKYREIEDDLNQTHQMKRHHEECREDMRAQVLALHGISADKLQGRNEYANARFQGIAAAVILCSSAAAILSGFLYGVTSPLTLYMGFCVGVEGALLSQSGRRWKIYESLCRIFFLLPLPAMATALVCMQFYPEWLELSMTIGSIGGLVMIAIGLLPYFAYNPYRAERRKIHEAESDLKELKQLAEKAVRKNRKIRFRTEKKLARQNAREAAEVLRREQREQSKLQRKEAWETAKNRQKEKWTERQSRLKARWSGIWNRYSPAPAEDSAAEDADFPDAARTSVTEEAVQTAVTGEATQTAVTGEATQTAESQDTPPTE